MAFRLFFPIFLLKPGIQKARQPLNGRQFRCLSESRGLRLALQRTGEAITRPEIGDFWAEIEDGIIVNDDWWYTMISIWWYTMIYYDILWYTMIYYDILWYIMIYYDILWYTMIYYDILWYQLEILYLMIEFNFWLFNHQRCGSE